MSYKTRYRQIHLDFHTSPVIPDVGEDFDVKDFVNTLKDAHVNSINIFAKCHHGMCYYPTKVGKMHPSLKFDLLGTMIKELHANDITCPIYFPLGWEEDAADRTEWLEIGRDNVPGHKLPTESGNYRWRKLCLNNACYREHIKAQLQELMENYDIDGFWFDIVNQEMCLCPTCLAEMKKLGLDPADDLDVKKHDDIVLTTLHDDLNDYVHNFNPDITTVFNTSWSPDGGYDEHTIENRSHRQDHMEIESLPSGFWGYLHFPLLVNFHNRDNKPIVGMNGKFHLSWGDHGSLKNQEALEFECFRMLANGCMVSVGDQLHPRGRMNYSAYKRIGKVYEEIEKLEPYLDASDKCADIGVVVSADFYNKDTISDSGALRMLMQLHYQFDLISITDDIEKYSLVILPDSVNITEVLNNKLKTYISHGGHVISTYHSICDATEITCVSDNKFTPSYIVIDEDANKALGTTIDPLEYVCYETGTYVKTNACKNKPSDTETETCTDKTSDANPDDTHSLKTVAFIGKPYFNRTAECFSSHMHFPYEKTTEYPAILMSDRVGYCAFPLFKDYMTNGNRVYREIIGGLVSKLLPDPILATDAPSYAEITVRKVTRSHPSLLIHVLSYIPQRLTNTIDIVNEPAELSNIHFYVRDDMLENGIHRIKALRSSKDVEYKIENGRVIFTLPDMSGYEVILIE